MTSRRPLATVGHGDRDRVARTPRTAGFTEPWTLLRHRKRYWLGPIVLILLLLGALILLTDRAAVAPFVYDVF